MISAQELRAKYDAVVLAVGATQARDLNIPGREASGIHQAMAYLPWGNKQALGQLSAEPPINASGKRVVILGGGDTGADCLGTAIRQGAKSITQIEIMPRPSEERPAHQPWPTYPMVYRVSSAHEEGGEREGDGRRVELHGRGTCRAAGQLPTAGFSLGGRGTGSGASGGSLPS